MLIDLVIPGLSLASCGPTRTIAQLSAALAGCEDTEVRLISQARTGVDTLLPLHSNGIWHPLNHWCARAARRHDIPLVIQPRGMLEPWALGWRATKKRLALALYQRRDLESAALLVATAEQEAENLRRFGLRQPIAIIPNGVDLLGGKVASTSEAAARKSLRYALFLSRVHPIKGLENLLRVWAKTQPQDWILQIAGPDEGRHLGQVLALAERLGDRDTLG
ncbi:MAG: glycosyltransferase [Chromatiaceae bacterium]|nr:glycosyltransferase [Chromatiaceae bacterium]MCF8002792.1 glycosyltransferase [Chromatiaceae bacterium]